MKFVSFPCDTRLVELLSALAFLVSAMAVLYCPPYFIGSDENRVSALFAVAGLIQTIPFVIGREGLLLRTVMALAAGGIWLWAAFSVTSVGSSVFLVVGLACLYSFIINFIIMQRSWSA